MKAKHWLALVVGLLLVIFTAQNYRVVELRFLFWKLEMSRAVMIFGVFVAGIVVGSLVPSLRRVRSG